VALGSAEHSHTSTAAHTCDGVKQQLLIEYTSIYNAATCVQLLPCQVRTRCCHV